MNLNEKEKRFVELRIKQNLTQEKTAELMDFSIAHIRQKLEPKIYSKIIDNWSELKFLDDL